MGRSPERAKAAEEKLRYWTVDSRDDDVREAVRAGLSIARIQKSKKPISHLPAKARTALGKQDAAVARRKRADGASAKIRAELYEIAQQHDLPGRPDMGRGELARKLGES
jgi:hypothetical protein